GPINDARDIAHDPHFIARGLWEQAELDGRPMALPSLAPRLVATPGRSERAGPSLGADTDAVLAGLGYDADAIAALKDTGAVAGPATEATGSFLQ
ncbi:MAG TPA: CoA transferase, partial [Thermoleophilaceae bacterium]|nr:CoA transferase [Thermoleophilaceae bacterium]